MTRNTRITKKAIRTPKRTTRTEETGRHREADQNLSQTSLPPSTERRMQRRRSSSQDRRTMDDDVECLDRSPSSPFLRSRQRTEGPKDVLTLRDPFLTRLVSLINTYFTLCTPGMDGGYGSLVCTVQTNTHVRGKRDTRMNTFQILCEVYFVREPGRHRYPFVGRG